MMIMMWGVHTKAQAPTPMPTYKHGLDMQGSNKYNTYRTDNTVANGTQVQTSDFTGEFQLFVNAINNHWIKVRELNSSYIEYFSYRIENIGYPFLPNCDNSDFNNRKFVIANSSTYSYPRYQISGLTNVTHVFNEINREIENQYPNSNSFNVAQPIYKNGELVKHVQLNRPMTLVSDFYKSGFNANLPLNRYYLPQGIFKITYYLEAGCENEVYADSVSFMVDCTRGSYNKYPFYPINFNNEAKAVYHDLSFFGYLGMPPNYNQSSNSFNTLNYVIPSSVYTGKQACNEIYTNPNLGTPTGYNSNYELPIFNNTTSYILSADYSLNLFENRSGVGAGTYAGYRDNNGTQTLSPGIPHTYTIDSPFDITQINPDEKVFYNPSVVSITSPYLVFPAGYTFKTVRGLYPTATQVYTEQAAQQANTGNAYRTSFTYDDPRHVYIHTDLAKSIYNVESGATLYIQPCVTIWDATINVKTGGKLVYDPTKTYGNYTIINQGGSIVATTYDEEVCTECNYPNKYNYLNHNVTANYTYTAGIHRIRDYVQVNAGATFTIPESGTGINIIGHTNYLITENTFINAGSTTNRAIVSSNSGSATAGTAEIYKNTINGVKQNAVETQNQNQKLKIDCNAFVANKIDISVISGTLANQGSCTPILGLPAANTFGTPCGPTAPSMSIIKNTAVPAFNYNSYPSKKPPIICVSSGVNLFDCDGQNYNPTTDCLALPGYGAGTSAASAAARTANVNTATTTDQKTHYTNELVRLYLETGQTALAKQVLANCNTDWAKLILLKHAIANNTADVATLISAMPNNPAISNLISDNNNSRYFKNIDAQNLNTQIPDSTDITLNKQARWSYVNNKQIHRVLNGEQSNYRQNFDEIKIYNLNNVTLNIIPNPSNSEFNIQTDGIGTLYVYKSNGILLETKVVNKTVTIGNNYDTGLYIIRYVSNKGDNLVAKAIKL